MGYHVELVQKRALKRLPAGRLQIDPCEKWQKEKGAQEKTRRSEGCSAGAGRSCGVGHCGGTAADGRMAGSRQLSAGNPSAGQNAVSSGRNSETARHRVIRDFEIGICPCRLWTTIVTSLLQHEQHTEGSWNKATDWLTDWKSGCGCCHCVFYLHPTEWIQQCLQSPL